jgi:hypothetical protein
VLKLGKELKKAKKTEEKGGRKIDYQEFNRQLTIIQETGKKPEQKLHKIGQSKWKTPVNNRNMTKSSEDTTLKSISSYSNETSPKQMPLTNEKNGAKYE